MNDLSRLSKEDLRKFLDETTEHIDEIRAELERREQAEQHQAIDDLDLYLERATVDWGQVKDFFRQVLAELREGKK